VNGYQFRDAEFRDAELDNRTTTAGQSPYDETRGLDSFAGPNGVSGVAAGFGTLPALSGE
jgi:hypothetical protein